MFILNVEANFNETQCSISRAKPFLNNYVRANNNGYSVIRILQDDVYNDRFEWLNELDENIQKIINDKQIQNIYICKMNEYNLFK